MQGDTFTPKHNERGCVCMECKAEKGKKSNR